MNTLFDKIWDAHVVSLMEDGTAQLYIDRLYCHEVTTPQAFEGLRERGIKPLRPQQIFCMPDHNTPTCDQDKPITDPVSRAQVETLKKNAEEFGLAYFGMMHPRNGIVHVVGPERGLTLPGMTVVCGDSHTSTHGAMGAVAFGIGTSEVEMALATQCVLQQKPQTMRIRIEGVLGKGVTAKDVALYVIAKMTTAGATGYFVEYAGSTVRGLSMEGRLTLCNLSIEMGARGGMIAPDETTFAFLKGREYAPGGEHWNQAEARRQTFNEGDKAEARRQTFNEGDQAEARRQTFNEGDKAEARRHTFNEGDQAEAWDKAAAYWRTLKSDDDAVFDKEVCFKAEDIEPMITYGTNPGMGMGITQSIPLVDAIPEAGRSSYRKSLAYMNFQEGETLIGKPVDYVFLGSCTNGRLEDFRIFTSLVRGRQKAPEVTAWLVPGSWSVDAQIRTEGLDKILEEAGFTMRQPGCSACLAMNDDKIPSGKYAVSTSNRNFEGRQGPGARTLLASPLTAAAAAITGEIIDPRQLAIENSTAP